MRVHFEKILTQRTQSFSCREFRSRVFTAPFHFHPEFELTAIVAGCGRRFVGDSVEDFGPGDLVLLGANLPHRWASTPPSPGERSAALVLQFRRESLGETFFDVPELASLRRLLDRAARGLQFPRKLATAVQELMGALGVAPGARRIELFLAILDRLAGMTGRPLASRGYRASAALHDAARIDRVISYVEMNYGDETLALGGAARVAALTPSAFSRFFARTTGRTFVRFVNEVRLSHACRWLVESDRSVAEICFACGFGTASNFHARFREARNTSPLGYRRMFQSPGPVAPARFSEKN